MGTKNNPKNRVKTVEKKKHDGKEIEPILYYGMHNGHGKYMAGKYAGSTNMVCNADGKPTPWADL